MFALLMPIMVTSYNIIQARLSIRRLYGPLMKAAISR